MIVDASAAVPLLIDHPMSTAARATLSRKYLSSPSLILPEIANALWKYTLRSGMDASDINASVAEIAILVEVVPDADLLPAAIKLAVDRRHPVYDCLYLALALRRREPLATADRRLASIARGLSIETELIEPAI